MIGDPGTGTRPRRGSATGTGAQAPDDGAQPLVELRGLTVSFPGRRDAVKAVRGLSLTVRPGESVALVGESGSGKSVTARSLVGLAGPGARVTADTFKIDGREVGGLTGRQWRPLRGRRIGFVLQDALVSLDPLRRVGDEIAEALHAHRSVPRAEVPERVLRLLADAGVPDPELRARQYPHELSGGLRQRALIASAIAAGPALLIADEPTTALDVTVQAQILDLLAERRRAGMALLLISHDLAVVAKVADRVLVMKDGEVVEEGPTAEVLADPGHPYTRQLLDAVPHAHARGTRLSGPRAGIPLPRHADPAGAPVVLAARGIGKSFAVAGHGRLTAVEDVSFSLRAGRTLGIVGESGSGKSTTGRLLLGLTPPDTGSVEVEGTSWLGLSARERRALHRRVQVVHQDPLSSFDPRYTVSRILAEPLAATGLPRGEHACRVDELMDQVGLGRELLRRRPRQLSGGQRQRVAIARALAPHPRIIVLDEPVAALDVSIQAQVLDLLLDLQAELGVAYVFISHDLGVVHHIADEVLVMKDGRTVEAGDVGEVFAAPRHPYTRALLDAVPQLDGPSPRKAHEHRT
ncbi:ABC transporter ATP-binding protein [Streptomyces sp. CB03911]|uniref:dipeptide ABC transporter ATP-binding protein n=1 Tax=Streptomyces sp. CB03911 TaxID=1804758 RepID=UPI0009A0BFB5|nr:ABC transporter ATP-binding protein [Streptomyces sp. CB03911]